MRGGILRWIKEGAAETISTRGAGWRRGTELGVVSGGDETVRGRRREDLSGGERVIVAG